MRLIGITRLAIAVALFVSAGLASAETASRADDKQAPPKIQQVFQKDGKTLESEIITMGDGTVIHRAYSDGKLWREQLDNKDGSGSEAFYCEDGKSLWKKLAWDKYKHKELSFFHTEGKLKGKLSHKERVLSHGDEERTLKFVKVYDEKGRLTHEQAWIPTWEFGFDEMFGGWKLGEVTEFDPASRRVIGEHEYYDMKRRIILRQDKDGVPRVVYGYEKRKFVSARHYDEKGFLEKEEIYNGVGYHTKTVTYTQKDNKHEADFSSLSKYPRD